MKQKTSRSLENRLITTLAQRVPREDVVSLLNSSPDWKYVFQTAEENRVTPLLFQKMKTNYAGLIRAEVISEFGSRQQNIARLNFGRTTQLIRLVQLLQDNNIPVIAYKGMALAATAYGDIGMRQFTDIDLLIHKKDVPQVKNLFSQIDCNPAWKLTAEQEKAVIKYYYEYPFLYGENRTLVEVHWQFAEPFFVFDYDYEELWKRVQPVKLYGKTIPTLSPEDSLIVLCTHGSKHFWKRLSWICDIAKLIENTKIDWEIVVQRSAKTGSRRMVLLGLLVAKEILNVELPAEISQRIAADRRVRQISEKLKSTVFKQEEETTGWITKARCLISATLLHCQMRERKRDKFRYAYRRLKTRTIDLLFLPMGRPQ